jgi:hypothetical protein
VPAAPGGAGAAPPADRQGPVAEANYITANAGDALLWNRSQALELFAALQNDKPVPAGLLTWTTVG